MDKIETPSTAQAQPTETKIRRPWVMWLLFFFQYASVGIYFTFINVYYRQFGLNGTQIGLLNMTTALLSVGSAVIWGMISDRTGKSRLLIAFGAFGAAVIMQFIPSMHTLTGLFVVASAGALAASAPSTLVDSTVLSLLGARREDYGNYRLGGTIGYIITGFSSGFLFERVGLEFMFPAYGIAMAGFALTALLLPDLPVRLRTRGGKELGKLVRQPVWIVFIITVFLVWMGNNAVISFLSVSLKEIGASQSLIGIASTIGAVTELPFMFYSGRLLRRFGAVRLLMVAIVMMGIRFALLGMMRSPEWAVAINTLNGPAFVFFWNSAVTYANRLAPPGLAGTSQGLLSSSMALAGVVSSLLSGWLFDLLGPTGLFLVMAGIALLALVLFGAGNMRQAKA